MPATIWAPRLSAPARRHHCPLSDDPATYHGQSGRHLLRTLPIQQDHLVGPGTTSGERMHKSRHTAGQLVLDATGNLKAVQKLLSHASIQNAWRANIACLVATVLDNVEGNTLSQSGFWR
jgi:hypothetical protein